MVFTADSGPFLIKTTYFGNESQTAANIGADIDSVRQEIEAIGIRDTAFLSDNCATMQLVRTTYETKTNNAGYLAFYILLRLCCIMLCIISHVLLVV